MARKQTPAFDPDAFLAEDAAPSFDPDAFLKDEKPAPSLGRRAEAAIEGFGNMASFGYLPQLQGAVSQLIPDPNRELDEKLKAEGFNVEGPDDSYVAERDRAIKRGAQLKEEAPGAYTAGAVGGLLASSAVPARAIGSLPGMGKTAATGLGRITQGAVGGALTGAVQNPGDREGVVDPLQLSDRADAATTGAALGGAFAGAAEAGKGLLNLGGKVRGAAEARAVGAAGASKADVKKLIKQDKIGEQGKKLKELGRYVLDNDIVRAGDDIEDIASRIGTRRQEVGKALADTYDSVSREGQIGAGFDATQLADEFVSSATKGVKGKAYSQEARALIEKQAENLMELGPNATLDQLLAYRSSIDDMIPYNKGISAIEETQKKVLLDMRRFLQDRIDQQIDSVGKEMGRDVLAKLKSLRKDYSKLSDLDDIARNRLAGEKGNNLLSLTDKIALFGGAGIGAGSALESGDPETIMKRAALGALAGGASKLGRTYGRPLVTRGMDAAGGLLNLPKQALDQLTPQQLEALAKEAERAGLLTPGAIGSAGARTQGGGFIK